MSGVEITQERVTLSANFLRHIADLLDESGYSATSESIRAVIAARANIDPATAPLIAALEEARGALELAEGLHSWLAHRFGVKGPEYAEVAARSKKTAAALTRITAELAKHKGDGDAD